MHFETLGQYHDAWSTIILFAPSSFRTFDGQPVADQAAALDEAFELIRSGFVFVEKKLKDQQRLCGVLREMIDMAHEAYRAGDARRGAHVFQECEGLIWPSRQGRLKYAVEAEQRRWGDLQLFKHVKVSPYPLVGTAADLGSHQVALLAFARQQAQPFVDANEAFKSLTWVMKPDGSVHPVQAASRKKTAALVREAVASGEVVACASAHLPFGSLGGLLSVIVEEAGRPRAEVISLVDHGVVAAPYHHLHEPEFFSPPADDIVP